MTLSDLLLSRGKRTASGCLEYTGSRCPRGYGRISCEGKKSQLVHRVAYRLWVEDPGTRVVMHTCDNPTCFEPSHLRAGTKKENSMDMAAKGRAGGQGVTHCPAGHEYLPGSYYGSEWKKTCKACAKERSRRRYRESRG